MKSRGEAFTLIVLVFATACAWSQQKESPVPVTAFANVSAQDLLARPVGANWTSYNGDYTGRRYSSLTKINPENVAQLRTSWVFHPGNSERLEGDAGGC